VSLRGEPHSDVFSSRPVYPGLASGTHARYPQARPQEPALEQFSHSLCTQVSGPLIIMAPEVFCCLFEHKSNSRDPCDSDHFISLAQEEGHGALFNRFPQLTWLDALEEDAKASIHNQPRRLMLPQRSTATRGPLG
jgi:hypothetical protein